jgi:hypothetical protein
MGLKFIVQFLIAASPGKQSINAEPSLDPWPCHVDVEILHPWM